MNSLTHLLIFEQVNSLAALKDWTRLLLVKVGSQRIGSTFITGKRMLSGTGLLQFNFLTHLKNTSTRNFVEWEKASIIEMLCRSIISFHICNYYFKLANLAWNCSVLPYSKKHVLNNNKVFSTWYVFDFIN